ncbi:hypothetical protein GWK78_02200 [Candidatus Saccharibacteria bacterium oral taxon 488]|nr:hypothetical protein GWK78_02200 [Candidatus Saccharibacteria bacterium oral taxon 488]
MHELAQPNDKDSRLEIHERPIDHTDTTNRLSAAAIVNTLGPGLNIKMLTPDQMNAIHGYYDDLFQKRTELWQTVFDSKKIRPYGLSEDFSTIGEAYRELDVINGDPTEHMLSLQNTFAHYCADGQHDLVFKGLDAKQYDLYRLLKEELKEVREFNLVAGSSVDVSHDRDGATYDLTFGTYLEGMPLSQFKCKGMGRSYEHGIVGYNDAQPATAKTIDGLRRAARVLSGLTESVNEELSDQLNEAGIQITTDTISIQEIGGLEEKVLESFYGLEADMKERQQIWRDELMGAGGKIETVSRLSTKAIRMFDFLKNAAGTDPQK